MNKRPWLYLCIAIFILIVPTLIYLCFLIPQLKEEYSILMASGGVIAGSGFYGANQISEKWKYGSMFKLASKSFTIMTVGVLIQEFYIQIIGCICTFILSYIIFKILLEVWKNARRRKQNTELATEVARNIAESSK